MGQYCESERNYSLLREAVRDLFHGSFIMDKDIFITERQTEKVPDDDDVRSSSHVKLP